MKNVAIQKAPPAPVEFLTDKQVMGFLQIGRTTLHLLMNRKEDPLPCIKLVHSSAAKNPRLRFHRGKFAEWQERQTQ